MRVLRESFYPPCTRCLYFFFLTHFTFAYFLIWVAGVHSEWTHVCIGKVSGFITPHVALLAKADYQQACIILASVSLGSMFRFFILGVGGQRLLRIHTLQRLSTITTSLLSFCFLHYFPFFLHYIPPTCEVE